MPAIAAAFVFPMFGAAAIIGHNAVDQVSSLPQSAMDAVGRQKWLFTHASVGADMIQGMQTLHDSNPQRYRFTSELVTDYANVHPPPAETLPGMIYDGRRGNPGWREKFAIFDDAVRNLGWRSPTISVAMDKLCFIDQDASPTDYLTMMSALETDFPDTTFVYMTMPIMTNDYPANILRDEYNDVVRAYCRSNNRVLFDIADIEAYDPDGNPITFTNKDTVYQRMYEGYTTDGGHLNALGQERVALGWYATAASLSPVLNVSQTETNAVVISWPRLSDDWPLEFAGILGSSWAEVPRPYRTNETAISVIFKSSAGDGSYFRLRKP